MTRDTVYDDHLFPKPKTTFVRIGSHSYSQAASKTITQTKDALLAFTDAHFEDRTQTNYQNSLIGKHNKTGGMTGQDGRFGFVHNPDVHTKFFRITNTKAQPHGDNPFRPYRIGDLMPERGAKGRYQYKDSYSVEIDNVVSPEGSLVSKNATAISSSAFSWNSEIKFNKYISHEPQEEEEGDAAAIVGGGGTAGVAFTDVTYSSSATVRAFSAYDGIFGESSNYSATANTSQPLSQSQMSNQQSPVSSSPITSY